MSKYKFPLTQQCENAAGHTIIYKIIIHRRRIAEILILIQIAPFMIHS